MTLPQTIRYDPTLHGALCDKCPLVGRTVVPPEMREGKLLVIGWEPGDKEERSLTPFVGPSGAELERALNENGKTRSDVSITNARLCRKRKSDPKAFEKQSMDCCRPRLLKEIEESPAVLMLGAQALEQVYGHADEYAEAVAAAMSDEERADAVADALDEGERDKVGGEGAISKLRGFPLWLFGKKPALASWHPAFVLRARRWTECFRWDVGKAFRHAAGRLDWVEPEILLDPSLSELENALARLETSALAGEMVATDTETVGEVDGVLPDPENCRLRCTGIGDRSFAIVAPELSLEVPARIFKLSGHKHAARDRIKNFYARLGELGKLTTHNGNLYDRPVLARHGMQLPDYGKVRDSIIAHHVADSEFRHGLDFLSSRYLDAPKHKPGGNHKWKDDWDLQIYCGYDCITTARIWPRLAREVIASNQSQVYISDVKQQKLCVGLHRAGMYVDIPERERHRARLVRAMEETRTRIEHVVDRRFNPGSHDQIRSFLFDECGMPWPTIETEAGLPSTSKDALYEMMSRALAPKVEAFMLGLLDFRRAQKQIGYVDQAMPSPRDGRVHGYWNPHVQVVGRLSASNPPMQTIPGTKDDLDSLRSMYRAAPGNILVYADMAQFHPRLIAVEANDELWSEAFLQGRDVHLVNTASLFQVPFNSLGKGDFRRPFGKTLGLAYVYSAGVETVAKNVRKVRDPKTGKRPYANFSLRESELMRKRMLSDHPTWEKWWDACVNEWRQLRYIADRFLGRKRYFKDSALAMHGEEDRTDIINHTILATEGGIMGGNGASGRLMDALPWDLYGPGIIFHGHDSLMVEVEEKHADLAERLLVECMTTEFRGMPLIAETKRGYRWSELG